MERYGLVGFPLTHSFSKKYFSEKFESLGLSDRASYELFELEDIAQFPALFSDNSQLRGLNVTIPYKQKVIDFLDDLDASAKHVGAVNVVKRNAKGQLIGFNSDVYGFKRSLLESLAFGQTPSLQALVLGGGGGAAKAVVAALDDLHIPMKLISRQATEQAISYAESSRYLASHLLIINCTPLGTFPKTEAAPDIDYTKLTPQHFLFDLVYNPAETLFLKKGLEKGAGIKNGNDMLVYQAEKSWEIWQNDEF